MHVLLASLVLAASTSLVPLTDLDRGPYMWGYYGGLWDPVNTGDETIPADHLAGGMRQAAKIQPLDANGNPDPNGKIGFMSVGYINTQSAFNAFTTIAVSDSRVNKSVVFVNAAGKDLDINAWEFPTKPIWSTIDQRVLAPAGVTRAQVQAAWMQEINQNPFTPLPIQYADSYLLKASIADTLRTLKQEFPNLHIVYLSDPQYAGYGTRDFLTEPFAYEDAFADRWVILGQILYMRQGEIWDPRIGDVDYVKGSTPFVTWGPYMWANGDQPRADGLTWLRSDYNDDGNTLSFSGAQKSADLLMNFMLKEQTAANWFLDPTFAPRSPVRRRLVKP